MRSHGNGEPRLNAFICPATSAAGRGGSRTGVGGNGEAGITSVCSAHPLVVEAAMRQAAAESAPLLIEATCNQVNHQGGYTGLTPAAFRDELHRTADRVGFARQRILLGGDHLGPNPWRHLPVEVALAEAAQMVAAYAAAGYQKIHLDTSMGCRGDPEHLPGPLIAERAADLAVIAEQVTAGAPVKPWYVIGTEVPVPGGAADDIEHLEVTAPQALLATLEEHRRAFAAAGAQAALERVIAVVVQPGVEFDNQRVVAYEPDRARLLSAVLAEMPELVFEAHSTDYQSPEKLAQLVGDGFAILKVGPALTFALREGLYALDNMAAALFPDWRESSLMAAMETEMLANPGYWQSHYRGGPDRRRVLRHYSYSDRIRYYWSSPGATQAVERLMHRLSEVDIPEPLISQFLPTLYRRVASGALGPGPRNLALEVVRHVLRTYYAACRQ